MTFLGGTLVSVCLFDRDPSNYKFCEREKSPRNKICIANLNPKKKSVSLTFFMNLLMQPKVKILPNTLD